MRSVGHSRNEVQCLRTLGAVLVAGLLCGCVKVPRFEREEVEVAWKARDFGAAELQPVTRDGVVVGARLVQGQPFVLLDFISPEPAKVHVEEVRLSGRHGEAETIAVDTDLTLQLSPLSSDPKTHGDTEHIDLPLTPDAFDAFGAMGYRLTVTWRVGDDGASGTTDIDFTRSESWAFAI